jgi:putative membrane protein
MRWSIVLPAVAVVLSACSPGQTDRRQGAADAGSSSDTITTGSVDTASSGTRTGEGAASASGILSRLEEANIAEIETSKLAARQGQTPAVRKIAQQLVMQHDQNRKELEALAQRKQIELVGRSGGSTVRDTSGVLVLKGLTGRQFDSAFVAAQIEAHRTNIEAIQGQLLPAASDPDIRQYLEKTRAEMEKHLASLEAAQAKLPS